MPQMKKAVITFDPERISQINIQAEGEVLAYIIREGLLGRPYAKERDINMRIIVRIWRWLWQPLTQPHLPATAAPSPWPAPALPDQE